MIRRKGGAPRHARSAAGHLRSTGIDELLEQLDAGSVVAGDRLAALAASDTPNPRVDPADVLDRIAMAAAAGSAPAMELLLGLIVEFELAVPAIKRLIQSPVAAEDIEQDVLLTVTGSIHGFRGDARFTTWLYSLARNVTVGHLRRTRTGQALAADDLLHDNQPRRMSSQVTQRHVVRQAIESLPPRLRQTVFLRDIEGLSYDEIAKRQGLELNTVRSRLSRGRAMLAARLS